LSFGQTDNTVRENKNLTVLGYLAVLVGRLQMRVTGLACFKVGHTHNSLGQVRPAPMKFYCCTVTPVAVSVRQWQSVSARSDSIREQSS
jgi:hypothetical protein